MCRSSRRRVLEAGCGAAAFVVAGCLGDVAPLAGEGADPEHYDIVHYSTELGRPGWRENARSGRFTVFGSEDEARGSLEFERFTDDRREEVEVFLSGTDFEETVVLYVASVGPSTCYDAIEVRELGMAGATLTGETAVVDTSDGEVDCGAAETHPSALIRPEFDDRPGRVEITVVDGWGGRETIERAIE